VTVSIGGAILHSGEHWESWLQRADECLYRAKSEGRNRAVIADAPNDQSKTATSH
jgi:PleD family two-component response regulator